MSPILEALIVPQTRDLGDGFEVRRVLPSTQRRTVGPFVFFDQMGPVVLPAGTGLDVRPHPHIGLATVTYLFDGEILHRDSLGTVQAIRPGAVNWMTAGRGIVHSERTPAELRASDTPLFGIQTWVGLPRDHEEVEPSFAHHAESALPVVDGDGKRVRIIAGELNGARSPLAVFSDTLYADFASRQRRPAGGPGRVQGAGGLHRRRPCRDRRRHFRGGPHAGTSATQHGYGEHRRADSPAPHRRRAARCTASRLVEFRLQLERTY